MRAGSVWIYRSPWGPVRATVKKPSRDGRSAMIVYKVPDSAPAHSAGETRKEHVKALELLPTRGSS